MVELDITFPAVVQPRGDGSSIVTPGKPVLVKEVSPKEAAKFLGLSRPSLYRLLEAGLITHRKPSPGKILVNAASLREHKEATRDPEFWERVKATARGRGVAAP